MNAAELLLDLGQLGIRLEAEGDKLRYHPRSALTPELLGWLKACKADLLTMLRPAPEVAPAAPVAASEARCRCGSTAWREVPIHGGRSMRRDCGRCGRFIDFPVWNGKCARQYG